jgi:hypothetical protein
LGIDVWTPLDDAALGSTTLGSSLLILFHTLLITDQRSIGTKRYYLDFKHDMYGDMDSLTYGATMDEFMANFGRISSNRM